MNDSETQLLFFTAFFAILWLMACWRVHKAEFKANNSQERQIELERENAGMVDAIREHNAMVSGHKVGRKVLVEKGDILDADILEDK